MELKNTRYRKHKVLYTVTYQIRNPNETKYKTNKPEPKTGKNVNFEGTETDISTGTKKQEKNRTEIKYRNGNYEFAKKTLESIQYSTDPCKSVKPYFLQDRIKF